MKTLNQLLQLHGDEFRFPKSMATFRDRNLLEVFSERGITHYAVCPSCYHLSNIISEPTQEDMTCNQPLRNAGYKPTSSGEFCEGLVYDYNRTSSNAKPVPQLEYSYCSIPTTLKKFFLRRGFAEQVKSWKSREQANRYLSDLYDATGFYDFKATPSETPFVLQSDYNLLLSLNVDWFSPFKSSHSVGCIYLTIHNLPKQCGRDLKQNMILVGVIPGPKEPPLTAINNYLAPMVNDLKVLLEGVVMKMVMQDGTVQYHKVRACLYSVSSDLPATKKLAASMSFNSGYGCHLCKTFFPRFESPGNNRNYCHWNCDQWEPRTLQETKDSSTEWKNARTARERSDLEKNSGVRYSILFELPYYSYNIIAIEPMHVLYLGVVKKTLETMLPTNALLLVKKVMQKKFIYNQSASCAPMANKITKDGMSYVKAAEYKHFITTMAEGVLRPPLLTDAEHALIMHLIDALRLLDNHSIKKTDVEVAHNHLLAFARGFEQRYGPKSVPPNFHFMLHLRECIYKFGPISCFWGFGFERNNYFIKQINSNHQPGFEKTFMDKMQSIIFANDSDSVAHYES